MRINLPDTRVEKLINLKCRKIVSEKDAAREIRRTNKWLIGLLLIFYLLKLKLAVLVRSENEALTF